MITAFIRLVDKDINSSLYTLGDTYPYQEKFDSAWIKNSLIFLSPSVQRCRLTWITINKGKWKVPIIERTKCQSTTWKLYWRIRALPVVPRERKLCPWMEHQTRNNVQDCEWFVSTKAILMLQPSCFEHRHTYQLYF